MPSENRGELTAERLAVIRQQLQVPTRPEDDEEQQYMRALVDELVGAYTAIAAQLAAVRAERDALRERVRGLETPTLYWDVVDDEFGYEDLRDLTETHDWFEPGLYEVVCAHILPNRWVVLAPDADDPDDMTCTDYATKDEAQAAYDATPARPTDTGRDG